LLGRLRRYRQRETQLERPNIVSIDGKTGDRAQTVTGPYHQWSVFTTPIGVKAR